MEEGYRNTFNPNAYNTPYRDTAKFIYESDETANQSSPPNRFSMLSDSLTSPSKRNSNMISLYRDSLFSNTIMMDEEKVNELENSSTVSQYFDITYMKDKNEFLDSINCFVCQKEFGILNGKKNCRCCGHSVCSSCSKRKRANPNDAQDFVRICDICHYNTINRFLQGRSEEQRKNIEIRMTMISTVSDDVKRILQEQQIQLDEIESLKKQQAIENKELETQAKQDIQHFQDAIENLENDIKNLKQICIPESNLKLQTVRNQNDQLQQDNQKLENEHFEILNEIAILEQQLNSLEQVRLNNPSVYKTIQCSPNIIVSEVADNHFESIRSFRHPRPENLASEVLSDWDPQKSSIDPNLVILEQTGKNKNNQRQDTRIESADPMCKACNIF